MFPYLKQVYITGAGAGVGLALSSLFAKVLAASPAGKQAGRVGGCCTSWWTLWPTLRERDVAHRVFIQRVSQWMAPRIFPVKLLVNDLTLWLECSQREEGRGRQTGAERHTETERLHHSCGRQPYSHSYTHRHQFNRRDARTRCRQMQQILPISWNSQLCGGWWRTLMV